MSGTARHSVAKSDVRLGYLVRKYISRRLERKEITTSTAKNMSTVLRRLALDMGYDRPPSYLNSKRIERWVFAGGISPGTTRNRLSFVRSFCHWLVEERYLRRDPTAAIRPPRKVRSVPRGLKAEQVGQAFAACSDERDVLMISLMAQEGLRACEVASLEMGCIDLTERLMLVKGKGDHERVLPISDETWSAMKAYLGAERRTAGPLIRSKKCPTKGISAQHVCRVVSEVLKAGGANASGHALRHTAATDMLRAGAHLRDVQAALGHASLQSTQIYLPWVVGDLRTAMGGRRYRGPALVPPSD